MIGIFIEPSNVLRKNIKSYKKKIQKNSINSIYSDHPPHSTIFFSSLNYNYHLEEKLYYKIKQINSFEIETCGIKVFKNDISTGKNTYFFKIKKNVHLNKLQKKILNLVKPYLNKIILKRKTNFNNNKKFASNFKNYGYPFVGNSWKPHFTIASCELERKEMYQKKLLPKKERYLMTVKYISIWRIQKDKHTLIKKIKLKK